MTDPKEKQPELPQVMFAGLGRGFAATASAFPANKAEAVTTEARMKSRMVSIVVPISVSSEREDEQQESDYKHTTYSTLSL